MKLNTDVLVVGGGATGAGIARDLALRGIPCILIERGDFASGASGRNHGLFHSGGRYAVSDPDAAKECIAENRILRRIAPHCIEETGGLFVSLPEDGLDFRDQFLKGCESAGIETTVLSRDEAIALEPGLNPDLLGAVEVPDGAIDPFTLIAENARDAEQHGSSFLLHTEVTSLLVETEKVKGLLAKDLLTGEVHTVVAPFVINATGAWASRFLVPVGIRLDMALSKGTMLITNRRLSQRVINRCRKPSDGDIIVPNDVVSILGTTSVRPEDADHFEITSEEVSLLIRETSRMVPAITETRMIRAYAGIRPLVQSTTRGGDRAISRGFTLIDHGERDGLHNLLTITGGKLVTYRAMAEKTCDLICQKMNVQASCRTHLDPLPGACQPEGLPGSLKERFEKFSSERGETICECELIPRKRIEAHLREGKLRELQDILHRTRLAKGTCQGAFCVYRLLGILHDLRIQKENSNDALKGFLQERWRGIRPVLWGVAVREEELIESIYKGMFNL